MLPKEPLPLVHRLVHPTRKLGKRAPRHDPRTLKLKKYLTPKLPAPPLEMGYVDKVREWPMFLNDQLGDCVCAAMGHMVEQWTTYSAGQPAVVTNQDVLHLYQRIGGYVPGHPETDNGCDMLTALKYWRKFGVTNGPNKHKIGAFVKVDETDRDEVTTAAWLFGSLFVGVQLPITAQLPDGAPPVWQVPKEGPNGDGSPGSWGGHCIPIVGYSNAYKTKGGNPGTTVVTWGSTYSMTWPFLMNYVDEIWAVLSPDWFGANNKAPSGFDIAQLQADLVEVGKP